MDTSFFSIYHLLLQHLEPCEVRWVYPEREIEVVLALQALDLWTPYKPRWMWAGAVAK
jgi:hypothetical protein